MIKILLDTNIVVYRESDNVFKENIGYLYNIIDNNPDMVKFIHPVIKTELLQNMYNQKRKQLLERLKSYNLMDKRTKLHPSLINITKSINKDENDAIDDIILNEIYCGNADILITEDKKIKQKSLSLNIANKVQTIEEFIYKNRLIKKVNHNILDIFKVKMKDLDIEDSFFDDLKINYSGFESWFRRKGEEEAYCYKENGKLLALLFLKNEEVGDDDYSDIKPRLRMNRKLKISTFKVDVKGKKIGERFMKIIFDQARYSFAKEVYVTIFANDDNKRNLIAYLEKFGFKYWGIKGEKELVYVRLMKKEMDISSPLRSYPYINSQNDTYVLAINPRYHTYLLPDSKLKREVYKNQNVSVEYAINKYYISHAGFLEKPKIGDNIVFYRTKQGNIPAKYSSVITTIGIVTNIIIPTNAEELCKVVKNKSVFTEQELKNSYKSSTYIIEFAYITTLETKLTYEVCEKNGILNDFPRGVNKITSDQFKKIIELGEVDTSLII